MLKKIFIFTVVISILGYQNIFSIEDENESPIIIPRASWWANSLYNDINSDYWQNILEARKNYVAPNISPEAQNTQEEKTKKINDYLNENFAEQFKAQETLSYSKENAIEYAWRLDYTEYIDSIIIHHTHSEYTDDITGLWQIHKFHSLSRQWWDIGYHYIIWYDGVIYEWREGGDYVVGAHSKYNNFWSVGIAVMGNYESEWINQEQYTSLESLVQYLTKHYGINLAGRRYYHMNCKGEKCNTFPIETYPDSVLIGHRDATHTSCPWEKLYEQIQQIRADNLDYTKSFKPIPRNIWQTSNNQDSHIPTIHVLLKALNKYSSAELEAINSLINKKLEQDIDRNLKKKLQILRLAVILSLND